VWFFSLDAGSKLAVAAARGATGLPYFHARMSEKRKGDEVSYDSVRTHAGAARAEFRARYRPVAPVYRAAAGSLDHWLTERYALFTVHGGQLLRLDIEHEPWPLQHATVDIASNTMAAASGITLPGDAPHVRYAAKLDVMAHWPVTA
jgi:uncharacterized protein YqjF (DUF2071 family)